MKTATFGNGCFWCTEAIFQNLKGVKRVESGYSGGQVVNPTYEAVCAGTTGHAEVIQLEYDELIISFEELLEVFFATHDPTTLNRQGNDVGSQYRSAIFYHSEIQKQLAEKAIEIGNESGTWGKKIVTQVVPFQEFYSSGDYHKDYFNRVGSENSYCSFVVAPKIDKFKKKFKEKLNTNG
jgi:peptide-methionine (S)-S-oxide reductase